eukprot:TRINITY_DN7603_c0_g1_i1.p1 TRINITY_DN7603_c0_g1~~TRINITY_DN7603_c0_g1_i1.p1  ORF type:complete len:160 (+),score=10.40 TRINITY_DN7603_c0_g1_i1:116-595(+)
MEWLSKLERESYSPFATIDINGSTEKIKLNGLKPVKLIMPGDAINLGGTSSSFRVCVSLMLPFLIDSDSDELHQWDIVLQFRGGMKPYPEYYAGCISNRMTVPLVFTQSVPLKYSLVWIYFFETNTTHVGSTHKLSSVLTDKARLRFSCIKKATISVSC